MVLTLVYKSLYRAGLGYNTNTMLKILAGPPFLGRGGWAEMFFFTGGHTPHSLWPCFKAVDEHRAT